MPQPSPLQRPMLLFAMFFAIAWFSHILQWESGLGTGALLAITAVIYVLIFFAVVVLLRQDGEPVQSLGLRVAGVGKIIMLAAVVGLIAQFILVVLVSAATGAVVFNLGAVPFETFLLQVLVMAFLTGFVEESAFRGYIQRKFTTVYGLGRALIIASILFMIPHIQVYTYYKLTDPAIQAALGVTAEQAAQAILFAITQTIIGITALGLFTGYLYLKSDQNVFIPTALHITFNIGGLLMLSYSNLQDASFTLDYGLFIMVWILWTGIVAALVWAAQKCFPKVSATFGKSTLSLNVEKGIKSNFSQKMLGKSLFQG